MPTEQKSGGDARLGARVRGRSGGIGWTRIRAVLSLGMVLGLGAVGTMAAWSDSATATTGMFSTSSIQLKVDNQRPTHQFTALKRNSMLPGQSVAGAMTVQNTGTIDFNWAVSPVATGSPALISKLKVSLYKTAANNGNTCSGALITTLLNASPPPAAFVPRLLAPGATEPVCIQVDVLSTAGQTEQFKIANLGFNFTAVGL
ncbi:SipW-dependent-type signal peptide-containing protein [Rhodococcus sp. NPDC056743]|uniref:SipW-dependent-type signal peptide-containing protein n=1 Tax=Rhodococcus sp. NPDC056743 TaxID=3345934 RepID=UPI0036733E9C